jgi:UDP-N-acetylglucosamine--N-acetylmuramyl-(pentapeptide) pyrophosphoryl-undecaprenol N-acetylglucosamine transferase
MERVPAAGYEIIGLPVAGFQRRITHKNITFFFKLLSSVLKARKVVRQFKPDVVVGVGGYASGPVLKAAASKGIPTVIQEQNSFPGVTNRILSKKAVAICVAYPGMERFFNPSKIIFTGNPVRHGLSSAVDREEALNHFGLEPGKKNILVVGGSLGAGSINNGILNNIELLKIDDVQVIWQTGKNYFDQIQKEVVAKGIKNLRVMPFVQRMDFAYSIADVVVSRAGAGTISELALLQKAVILVPSPNVSEDHQTKNAMALVEKNAAILVKDAESSEKLLPEALRLIHDELKLAELKENIKAFARPRADEEIARYVLGLVRK